jgi:hypothetical protein
MFIVGDIVYDDLTNEAVEVTKVVVDERGNIGYFVSSEYLQGGRHPWEITGLDDLKREH